jgi:hypothetical protein
MRIFTDFLFTKYEDDAVKDSEICGACGKNGRVEKCIQNIRLRA